MSFYSRQISTPTLFVTIMYGEHGTLRNHAVYISSEFEECGLVTSLSFITVFNFPLKIVYLVNIATGNFQIYRSIIEFERHCNFLISDQSMSTQSFSGI